MKKATRLLALALTMLPLFAAAQLSRDTKLVTNVPFDFMVANKAVPAGEWILQSASDGARTLLLNNVDAKAALFSGASAQITKQPAGASALVFHKYGDRYFLAAVKLEGSKTMYRIAESKAEAEMLAQKAIPTETILLASVK
jgi:hypothetical protein